MTAPTATPTWTGPARFLPPPSAMVRADGARRFSGVTYAALGGYRPLQLDVLVPPGESPAPLVIWIHGGAWMLGDRRYLPETLRPDQIFDELLDAGLAVATIDYRHAAEAPFPAQLHDAKAAVRYLRAHADVLGIETGRIGIWGESAGGHLAALVALTSGDAELEGAVGVVGPSSSVDVVVDWYGVADLTTMPRMTPPPEVAAMLPPELLIPPEDVLLAGLSESGRRAASPITHVTPGSPPFLLVHGTADGLVPYSQSQTLADALSAAGVPARLVPVDGAGHIFLGCADVDPLVRLSVNHLATALLPTAHRENLDV